MLLWRPQVRAEDPCSLRKGQPGHGRRARHRPRVRSRRRLGIRFGHGPPRRRKAPQRRRSLGPARVRRPTRPRAWIRIGQSVAPVPLITE